MEGKRMSKKESTQQVNHLKIIGTETKKFLERMHICNNSFVNSFAKTQFTFSVLIFSLSAFI